MKKKIIPFDSFIDQALYAKKEGYYSRNNPFGKKGDFITAPAISFLFGEMIAIWLIFFWENLKKPKKINIIELGPGDGKLIKILLKTFAKFPDFNKCVNIFLYEKSENLIKIQKKELKNKNIKWLKNFNVLKRGPVIFLGNEFFDAVAIKQFVKKDKVILEKYVDIRKKNKPKILLKKTNLKTIKELKKFNLLKKNGIIEYPKLGLVEINNFIKKINKFGGGILLIDYGYINQINFSSIQSIKKHKKNRLFDNIGNADITSLVNFGMLNNYFKNKKLKVNEIVTQGFFLKKLGIISRAELLSKNMSFKEKTDLYYRLKRLLHPNYMGEIFKVIFAYKSKKKFTLGFK